MTERKQTALEKKAEVAATEGVKATTALIEQVKGLRVRSATDAQSAADLKKKLRVEWKKWEEERKKIVDPQGAAIKAANDFFKRDPGPLSILEAAGEIITGKLTAWTVEEQKKEQERQAIAEKAAEEVRQREQEEADKLREEAEALEDEDPDRAQELHEQAEEKLETAMTTAAEPVKQAAIPKGFHTRENWTYEVTDKELLIKQAASQIEEGTRMGINLSELLLPNEKMLNDLAKSTKGNLEVPGVRIFNKPVGVGS